MDIKQMERAEHIKQCANELCKCEYCADTMVDEEVTEPWQDRSEYTSEGEPNQ